MYVLSVDFGTSSIKMAILDGKNNIIETAAVDYQYRIFNRDWVELDPDKVFDAFYKAANKLSSYLDKVEIVAYDTFSPSPVFMDKDGEALYPIITHLDRRSKKQTKKILNEMGKDAFQNITGVQPFTGGVSITTILWFMENMPCVFNRVYKLGHLNTFVHHKLTRHWATDHTNASMTGMYETTKWGTWSHEICNSFGIPEGKLPDIYNAGTIIGSLDRKAAELSGLRAGIPVILGSNDAATAQVGAGNINAGDILNISGSSEMVSIISDSPVIDDSYYLRNAITPGKWQIYATTTGGFALDWFKKEFYKDMDSNTFYNKEIPEVIQNHIDKTSVKFLPYLAGDRQSLDPKKAAFSELTLDTTRRDFLAAIFLGMHEPIIKTIELSGSFIRHNGVIKLTGGMVNEQFISLKRKLLKGFEIIVMDNCPLAGNGILALQALQAGNG